MEEQARFRTIRAEERVNDRILVALVAEILVTLSMTVGPVLLAISLPVGLWS